MHEYLPLVRLQVFCRPDFLGAVSALELELLVGHLVGLAGAQRAAPLPAVLALVPLVRRVRHPRVRRQLLLRVEDLGARRARELDPLVHLGWEGSDSVMSSWVRFMWQSSERAVP